MDAVYKRRSLTIVNASYVCSTYFTIILITTCFLSKIGANQNVKISVVDRNSVGTIQILTPAQNSSFYFYIERNLFVLMVCMS